MKSSLAGLIASCFLLCGAALSAHGAEVEGVKLSDKAQVASTELTLNGAGVRTRFFVRVYVGALYLQQKRTTAEAVLADAGPKRVAMHMTRDVAAERLYAGLDEGIKSNQPPEQVAKFAPQMKQFEAIFQAVKAARAGDVFFLDIVPGSGTRVTVNGQDRGTVPGDDFGRALLAIWLGEKPVDDSLKKAMLGG